MATGRVIPAGAPDLAGLLVQVFGAGGLVIMPCDTIYGIHGVAPDTEERIRSLKGRAETKPFIRLIAHTTWLDRLSDQEPDPGLVALWPGALTLVLRALGGGTVALRVPGDPLLVRVLHELDRPLFSTSVNRTGEAPLDSPAGMAAVFGAGVDLIVDAGVLVGRMTSTIVDATARPYRLIRQGALSVPSALLGSGP